MKSQFLIPMISLLLLACGGGGSGSNAAWSQYVSGCVSDGQAEAVCQCVADRLDDTYASPDAVETAGEQGFIDALSALSACSV